MSIIHSFDNSAPLITPANFYTKAYLAEKCIITFSWSLMNEILSVYDCKEETQLRITSGNIPLYSFLYKGEKLLVYLSQIGATCAGSLMEEVNYISGATKFIVFGSCGILDEEKTHSKFILPDESYRDEGFSYHYAVPADYIKIQNSNRLAELFQRQKLPFVQGRSWTTDALYMETVNNVAKRKADGCICVEMESAGLQALCDYKGFELFTFFFGSDVLDGESWENINLGTSAEKDRQLGCFQLALMIAEQV